MLRKYRWGIGLALSLLLATAGLTSGCGQKGPLYLPGEKNGNYEDVEQKAEKQNEDGPEESVSDPKKTGY